MSPENEKYILDFVRRTAEKYKARGIPYANLALRIPFTMRSEYVTIMDKLTQAAGGKVKLYTDSPLDPRYGTYELEISREYA